MNDRLVVSICFVVIPAIVSWCSVLDFFERFRDPYLSKGEREALCKEVLFGHTAFFLFSVSIGLLVVSTCESLLYNIVALSLLPAGFVYCINGSFIIRNRIGYRCLRKWEIRQIRRDRLLPNWYPDKNIQSVPHDVSKHVRSVILVHRDSNALWLGTRSLLFGVVLICVGLALALGHFL